ncbi:MAG: general secretion pathway protein GspB [Proteobacteria bacterium]|nr:general secretion pathway protein GspB [Pseudomonadota bacterium]
MSFILDALKKSEADRQQQSAPDMSSVPTGTVKAATPRWLWMLVGLLAVNLVVVTVILVKPSPVTPTTGVARTPERVVEPPPANPPAQEIPLPVGSEKDLPAGQEQRPPAEPVREFRPEVFRAQAPVQTTAPVTTQTRLTFNDLRVGGNISLPELNIDIHVYSDRSADRFVFINMHQYRENATLEEGPLLREITPEGVILEYTGAVFLLPKK